jgi:hypothetical protein
MFGPFFDKSVKSSAPDFPGTTKYFSALFELCGRNFGPFATLIQGFKTLINKLLGLNLNYSEYHTHRLMMHAAYSNKSL